MSIIPSHILLSNTDIELTTAIDHREARLKNELDKIAGEYDFIFIDCPPTLSWLTINALTASDKAIVVVSCHGPINIKRHNELRDLFGQGEYGLVFVTAFEGRKAMHKYLSEIAWETEVWVSEAPSHLIHFNGERFLGPYLDKEK